jgi:hypothetical protein
MTKAALRASRESRPEHQIPPTAPPTPRSGQTDSYGPQVRSRDICGGWPYSPPRITRSEPWTIWRPDAFGLPHRRARPGGRLIVSYGGPHSFFLPHRRARPGGRLIVSYSGPYSFGLRHRRAWLGCDQWQSTRFAKPQGRVTRPDIASGSASFPPAPDRLPSVAVDAVAPSHVLATRKPKSGSRLTG